MMARRATQILSIVAQQDYGAEVALVKKILVFTLAASKGITVSSKSITHLSKIAFLELPRSLQI